MTAKIRVILSLLFLTVCSTCFGQELSRRANWQTKFKEPNNKPGATIIKIEKGSPLEEIGLLPNDLILRVNNTLADSPEKWTTITYALRAEKETTILIRRKDEVFTKKVRLNLLKKEDHDNLETIYESITSDHGIEQRVIITKPKNIEGRQPAIFLVQGLSCSSIETYPGRTGNWSKHISSIVENSNMVVMRVEKPGVGDSEGDCSETDFLTELSGYRAAIRALMAKEYVDQQKIIVYGSSLGSTLAPVLANEFNLAGVISDGTFFKTWFEHMLEIERRIRQMNGDDEKTIVKKLNEAYIPLYYGMLIEKKSYAEVVKENPPLKDYNYHSARHMYGRSVKYYQQLQDFNLAGAWEKIKAPVRILYGSNDWIMSEFDNNMILEVLKRRGHQNHELMVYPGLDHWNTIHKSKEDSFNGKPGKWDENVPETIIKWSREIIAQVKQNGTEN